MLIKRLLTNRRPAARIRRGEPEPMPRMRWY
jgi:hypothetical protein